MTNSLTPIQSKVYAFLQQRISRGLPPTVREIMAKFGFTSPNGAICHLKALAKKGYIKRDKQRARSIQLVSKPGVCPCCGRERE